MAEFINYLVMFFGIAYFAMLSGIVGFSTTFIEIAKRRCMSAYNAYIFFDYAAFKLYLIRPSSVAGNIKKLFNAAVDDAYNRLIKPKVTRQSR